jgi:hypothetical protein
MTTIEIYVFGIRQPYVWSSPSLGLERIDPNPPCTIVRVLRV